MARAPSPRIEVTSRLQPVAAPVDAYVRPADPERSPLWGLAKSLGRFDRDLNEFLERKRAEAANLDAIRGQAEFFKQNQVGYAEAVRQGKIPSFASPAFMEGYKTAEGSVAGLKLTQEFQLEYMKWDGKDSDDPAAFDAFFQEFMTSRIKSDDPLFLKGLLPHVTSLAEGMGRQFQQDLSKNIYDKSVVANAAVTSQAVDHADLEGRGLPDGTDYDKLWDGLIANRDRALSSGIRAEDYDGQLIGVITAKAIQHRDPGLLGLMDRKLPGVAHKISDTPEGQKAKAAAEQRLEVLARQAESDEHTAFVRRQKEGERVYTTAIIEHLFENPSEPLPEELLEGAIPYIEDVRIKAMEWQRKVLAGGVAEDPRALTELYTEVLGGGGMAAVTRAIEADTIRDPQTLREATNFVRALEDGKATTSKILKGNTFSGIMKTIQQRTQKSGIQNPWEAEGLSDEGIAAQVDYQRLLLAWAAQNPDASELDMERVRGEIGRLVLGGVDQSDGVEDPTYTRPQGAEEAIGVNPFSPPPPPEEGRDEELEGFIETLTPKQRQRVEAEAERRGVPPTDLYQRLRQRAAPREEPVEAPTEEAAPEAPAGRGVPEEGASPINFTPEEATPEKITQRLNQLVDAAYRPTALTPSGTSLEAVIDAASVQDNVPPIVLASQYLGLSEGDDAKVLSALFKKMAGLRLDPSQTEWCAAFANAVLGEGGFGGTNSLLARDFLNYGTPIGKASLGDLVVFWRGSPDSWKGHVGFYAGRSVRDGKRFIKVLGGNQGNSVSVSEYPEEQLLGFRRPPTSASTI